MAKIYLAQMEPALNKKDINIKKIRSFIKQAAYSNADLVLFPELALTGLSTKEHTPMLAESINGDCITKVRQYAKEYNVMVIIGFPELAESKIYNSACFIDKNGEIIGVHRKVHLWGDEKKYYSAGNHFKVWETAIGIIGIITCYDTQFPESARTIALKGAEMILIPTGNMTPFESLQPFNISSRAEENQIFVLTTNLVGDEEDLHFFGESTAAGPNGQIMIKAGNSEEGVLVNVNLKKINDIRNKYNYLDDRRPEVYQDSTIK